jgi:hypothetical protein
MRTSERNRLVSANAAEGPLSPGPGCSVHTSAKPCARDPPECCVRHRHYQDGLRRARHAPGPVGDFPRTAANEERRCANIASPERRTRKS